MTGPRATEVLAATPETIALAAAALRQPRGLVAFPTETVYGLGADAENDDAVRSLFAAKGRPPDHPVIVHLAEASQLSVWAREIPSAARVLAARFWPGPMSLVLWRGGRASDLVTGGLDTVGLRVPAHPVARALLIEFGGAIAAPSANRFGRVSPTTAAHVRSELNGLVDVILDGGACEVGLESTIIDVTGARPRVLRPGAVTAEMIAAALATPIGGADATAPRVSGSLDSHYAPRARVEIVTPQELLTRAGAIAATGQRVAILASGAFDAPAGVVVLPLSASAPDQARQLYQTLRQVDELGCDVALVTLPPETGLGVAIADRLRRAAGPRP